MSKSSSKRKSRQNRRSQRPKTPLQREVPGDNSEAIQMDRVHGDDETVEIVQTLDGDARDGRLDEANDNAPRPQDADAPQRHAPERDDLRKTDAPVEASTRPAPSDSQKDANKDNVPSSTIQPSKPPVVQGQIIPAEAPEASEPSGVFGKLFSGGKKAVDADTGMMVYEEKPGVLRPLARKEYQREAALASIRGGFGQLSGLMADIRDGLNDSVTRQGELLEQLKYLPVVAKQNADASSKMQEQYEKANALQSDAVRAIREQVAGQRETSERLNSILSTMGKESRDQKRDLDDVQGRMDRMRESDQAISHNLAGVGNVLKHVTAQTAGQGEMVLKMQEQFEARTAALQEQMRKSSNRQSLLTLIAIFLGVFALGAVAAVGYLYLKSNGVG